MALAPEVIVEYGEVFTRRWVVEALLDLIGYTHDKDLASKMIVEPSVGSGAFIGPIVERLIASTGGVPDAERLRGAVRAYDLQESHVATSRALVVGLLAASGMPPGDAKSLATTWIVHADFLLGQMPSNVDFVVGNPPYIRTEELDDALEAQYRTRWTTMRGRADIYVGFFERGLSMLGKNGSLGYICADRWMRNDYGSSLRQLITDQYAVRTIWQMHDADAFEAEVSAYPAITVVARDHQSSVAVVEATHEFDANSAVRAVEFTLGDGETAHGSGFKAHRLRHWFEGTEMWPTGDPDRLAMLAYLNERFRPLEGRDKRTRIGIGVATGADRAFIIDQDTPIEEDRKLPLVMADDIRSGYLGWRGKMLANPWATDGSMVNLDNYPLLEAYLRRDPTVEKRFVAKKAPARWYRTIDKVDHSLVDRPKLLLQDMKATIQPVLEPGGLYPHHNLYFIVSDEWDLEVLGGLLLSRIAQSFIEAYCVRMRGGTLRFQAQYLRKIRVPDPDSIDEEVRQRLIGAFRGRDVVEATAAAAIAYGLEQWDL